MNTSKDGTPTSHKSNAKKFVRVRRTPRSSRSKENTTPRSSPAKSPTENKLIFQPGPVGLQLEPVAEDPKYGCRVVRFVDGGPKNAGQARSSGMIKPGDLVLKVEAEGITASTYKDIIDVLKRTESPRELTFKSPWDLTFLETQTSLKLQFHNTPSKPPLRATFPVATKTTKHDTPVKFPPVHSPYAAANPTSEEMTPPPQPGAKFKVDPATPSVPTTWANKSPDPTSGIDTMNASNVRPLDINLIHSPSEMVLLSTTPGLPRQQSQKRKTDGPLIIPLKSNYTGHGQEASPLLPPPITASIDRKVVSSPTLISTGASSGALEYSKPSHFPDLPQGTYSPNQSFDPEQPKIIPVHKTTLPQSAMSSNASEYFSSPRPKHTGHQQVSQDVIRKHDKASQSFVQRKCDSSAARSPDSTTVRAKTQTEETPFSPSNVRKLAQRYREEKVAPRLLARVFGSVFDNVAPAVASSSYAIGSTVATKIVPAVASSSYAIGSAVTTKIGEAIVGNSSDDFQKANKLKLELLKELSQAKADLDIGDSSKQELKRNMDRLFQENVSLRAEFEQKLQVSNVKHVSATLLTVTTSL